MILGNWKTEPGLKAIEDEHIAQRKAFEERKSFLTKQLEKYNSDVEISHKAYWDKVEAHLMAEKRFPEYYSAKKYSIQRDDEDGCFFLIKKGHGILGDIEGIEGEAIEHLMKSLPGYIGSMRVKVNKKKKDDTKEDEDE